MGINMRFFLALSGAAALTAPLPPCSSAFFNPNAGGSACGTCGPGKECKPASCCTTAGAHSGSGGQGCRTSRGCGRRSVLAEEEEDFDSLDDLELEEGWQNYGG